MEIDNSKHYILFDGDCAFCNYWVLWILERDSKDLFMFISLQSEKGQQFLMDRGLEKKELSTLYLWVPEKYYYTQSKAVIQIAKILGGQYALWARLNCLPIFFTDYIYNKISKNRKKLGLKKCRIPTEQEKSKILTK